MDEKDLYFIAVKLFLEREGKILIIKDKYGDWDLPGGRVRKSEFGTELEKVLIRKLSEELGNEIKYTIGKPIVFMRHERQEFDLNKKLVRIFAIGYDGIFKEEKIQLSPLHTEMKWVSVQELQTRRLFFRRMVKRCTGIPKN